MMRFNFGDIKSTDCTIDDDDFAHGMHGQIYLATMNGQKIAVKKCFYNFNTFDSETYKHYTLLLKLLHDKPHANIVHHLGMLCHTYSYSLYMPYIPFKLTDFITKQIPLKWMKKVDIAAGISSGLEYLHSLEIIYGDMKGENILIEEDVPKICDFDLSYSRLLNHEYCSQVRITGTIITASPELYFRCINKIFERNTKEMDVYALGIVILEFMQGEFRFSDLDYDKNINDEMTVRSRIQKNDRFIPKDIPVKIADLIKSAILTEYSKRPIAKKIREGFEDKALREEALEYDKKSNYSLK